MVSLSCPCSFWVNELNIWQGSFSYSADGKCFNFWCVPWSSRYLNDHLLFPCFFVTVQVRKLIWEGTLHLVQEGLKSGFLHCTTPELSCRRNVVPGHVGCGLAELCEMAKQFPAVNESDHQAVHVLDDETSIPEQDLLSCVTENSSECAKIVVLMGQKYLVPPKSSFLLSDISCLQPLLNCKYL